VTPQKKRALGYLWHGVVITLVAAAAWRFIDFGEVADTMASVTWPWILLILGLATLDRFMMAHKWRYLLRRVGNAARFRDVLSAYYQAGFIQRCIPTSLSGDAMRAVVISGRHGGTTGVLASMVVERLLAMLSAVFIALCGALLIMSDARGEPLYMALMAIPALLVVMLIGLWLTLHRPLVDATLNWLPENSFRKALTNIYGHYSGFRDSPKLLLGNFLYCLLEQVVQVVLLLACAIALSVEADVLTIVAAVSIAQCLRKFALLIEGWVLGEFTSILVYTALGIPGAQALAFSLLGQVAHMIASLPGAVLFARSTVQLQDLGGWLGQRSARSGPHRPAIEARLGQAPDVSPEPRPSSPAPSPEPRPRHVSAGLRSGQSPSANPRSA
jgi:uncharacterized protein (TIRG00374 family)